MKAKNDPKEPEDTRPFLELEEVPDDWQYQTDLSAPMEERTTGVGNGAEQAFLAPTALPLSYDNPLLAQAQASQERATRISRRVSAGLIIGGILLVIPVTRFVMLGFLVETLMLMRILTLPILLAVGLWMVYRLFYQRP